MSVIEWHGLALVTKTRVLKTLTFGGEVKAFFSVVK
jgi:hypothetical protein